VPAPNQEGGHKGPLPDLERRRNHADLAGYRMALAEYVLVGIIDIVV